LLTSLFSFKYFFSFHYTHPVRGALCFYHPKSSGSQQSLVRGHCVTAYRASPTG